MPTPRRGEVWLVDLGMVAKVRPCLVLSVPIGPQDRVLATLIGHTTSTRGSQFEVTGTRNGDAARFHGPVPPVGVGDPKRGRS